jgi:CRP/FNR family cyclic AMP-dependent transcriptional regulator
VVGWLRFPRGRGSVIFRGMAREKGWRFWDLLDASAAGEIRERSTYDLFRVGEALTGEGEDTHRVFFILSGWVSVIQHSPVGATRILAVRGPGDIVGELASLSDRPRSATVRARSLVEARGMTGAAFLTLAERTPSISRALLRTLAHRLQDADRHRTQLHGSVALGAVADKLLEIHAYADGRDRPVFTQEEIALWAGVSVPALARSLRTLREAGVIRSARQRIVVLDERALREIAKNGGIR